MSTKPRNKLTYEMLFNYIYPWLKYRWLDQAPQKKQLISGGEISFCILKAQSRQKSKRSDWPPWWFFAYGLYSYVLQLFIWTGLPPKLQYCDNIIQNVRSFLRWPNRYLNACGGIQLACSPTELPLMRNFMLFSSFDKKKTHTHFNVLKWQRSREGGSDLTM